MIGSLPRNPPASLSH